MIVFPAETRTRARATLLIAVLWSLPAAAQPVDLSPTPLAPATTDPQAPRTTRPIPVPTEAPVALVSPVQVDPLSGVEPDTVGTLTAQNGGFGYDMWRGTPRVIVDSLLPEMPARVVSPTLRDLARRLLMSAAAVPQGTGTEGSLVAKRISLLAAMGDLEAADALLRAAPGRAGRGRLARVEADLRLLTQDHERACALAAGAVDHREQDLFWQKALIFCQALAGQRAQAGLGLQLLREIGVEDEPFFALADGLATGGLDALKSLPDPSPLHLAMARVANAALPDEAVAASRPDVLRVIAESPNAAVDVRLAAAERAQAAGALSIDVLQGLYESTPFQDEDLANPLTRAEEIGGARARALLYRTARAQTLAPARAETLAKALELARAANRYPATVDAFLPLLADIRASASLDWFAAEAARAMLFAGRAESAAEWLGVLARAARRDADAAVELVRLVPLARLAGVRTSADADSGLEAWSAVVAEEIDARDRAALVVGLYASLGEPIPVSVWRDVLDGPPRVAGASPHPALWHRWAVAIDDRRVGETVLLTLILLGESTISRIDPVSLTRAVEGLKRVGLEAEARALAVEAAAQVL